MVWEDGEPLGTVIRPELPLHLSAKKIGIFNAVRNLLRESYFKWNIFWSNFVKYSYDAVVIFIFRE